MGRRLCRLWTRRLLLSALLLGACSAAHPAERHASEPADHDETHRVGPVAGEEREVEPISDQELARRASGSPDQRRLGLVLQSEGRRGSPAALGWAPLGPRPILKEFYSGDDDATGRVCSIAVNPRDPDRVYIAAAQGGVWKSVDGGMTWTPLTDQLSSLASGALALDPLDPDVVYYGTGEQHFSGDSFYGDGLFRSPDAGATWFKIASKASVGSYISRVAPGPGGNPIFVASDLGLVRSLDGGAQWTVALAGGTCTDLAVDPAMPSTVYAAIRRVGIYKSLDHGASWALLAGGLPVGGFLRINLALSPSDPAVLYASFVRTSNGSLLGMYRTGDGGSTWTRLAATPNYLRNQGWYDNAVVVDPDDPDICYAGGVFPFGGDAGGYGLIKTVDGGAHWTDVTVGKHGQVHADQHFLTFGPDRALWVASDGGVWKTHDGGERWLNLNRDLDVAQLYTATLHPAQPGFMLAGTQDNGTLRYHGSSGWPQLNSGDGGPSAVERDSPHVYYTTSAAMTHVYKWKNHRPLGEVTGPWSEDFANWANGPMLVDPDRPGTLLVGTNRVWRSPDGGASWGVASPDLTGEAGVLRALALAPGVPGVIYSASSNGRLFLTTDGGATGWMPREAGLPKAPLPDVVLDPSSWSRAYVCADVAAGDRVFQTQDAGVTWTSVTGDLPAGLRAMALAVDFRPTPHRLYLGTDYGVYASADGGSRWSKEAAGLPNCAVYDLALDAGNELLVAATHGRGGFGTRLGAPSIAVAITDASALAPGQAASSDVVLFPVTPNPARPPVTIGFELPRPVRISLEVFDLLGRRVRVLDRGPHQAGSHRVSWDGKDPAGRPVGAGIYLCRLEAGGLERVRRVVVVP